MILTLNMPDIDERLAAIENKLDTMVSPPISEFRSTNLKEDDEVDFRKLFEILWQGRWWIVGITFIFSVAGLAYSLSMPNKYTSMGVYAPTSKEGSAVGVGGQLGGLVSLAGINLNGGANNDIEQALALIMSWDFLEGVIERNNLSPLIAGVKGWDSEAGNIIWNNKVYNPEENIWISDPFGSKRDSPSSFRVYEHLSKMISVHDDAQSGLITIEATHYSPEVAKKIVDTLVAELNLYFRERDKREAQSNIEYLKVKISETSIAEMQAVFYGMVETQVRTLMLAEVGGEYLLKQVVPPKVAEVKSGPRRLLLTFAAVLIGGILSVFFVLVRSYFRS